MEHNTAQDALQNLSEEDRSRVQDLGDSFVITLVEPVTYLHGRVEGERTLTELTVTKRLKGKHLKKMDHVKGDIAQALALHAAVAGVPERAIDELDVRDIELLNVVMEPFLPKPHKIGQA